MKFSPELFEKESIKSMDDPALFGDFIFEGVLSFVVESCVVLDRSRRQFRLSKKNAGLEEFHRFKNLCQEFSSVLSYIEETIAVHPKLKKINKLTMASRVILEKGTKRIVMTKKPSSEMDFLDVVEITESDIDWILKRFRDYLGRFLQIYGTFRVDIVLEKNTFTLL